jgi:selenide,water dikinase
MIGNTTLLSRIGAELAQDHVHAITDVTCFGLLGHALEMARASRLGQVGREGNVIAVACQFRCEAP